jgi:hypothetical protein
MARQHLLALARRGAEVRLRELAHEARHLLAVFPHLGDTFDADELPVSFLIEEGARRRPATESAGRPGGASAARRRSAKKSWERRKTKPRN